MARNTPRKKKQKPLRQPPETTYKNGPGKLGTPIYPLDKVSPGKGMAVRALSAEAEQRLNNLANGILTNQLGQQVRIWIDEMEADFGVGGSTSQSQKVRQFFPRNFVQPSIRVTCTFPSQFHYNTFASFVRSSHIYALSGLELKDQGINVRKRRAASGGSYALTTVKFWIKGAYNQGGKGSFKGSKTSKGGHTPWLLEGYIKSIQAGAVKFEQAPQLIFEFTIAESRDTKKLGIWNDEAVRGSEIRPWLDIFRSRPYNDFVDRAGRPKVSKGQPFRKDKTRNPESIPTGFWDDVLDDVEDAVDDFF